MSARFPPPAASDARYPRDRSPPRVPDRRSASTYNDVSLASRVSEPGHRPNDAYNARREPPREPPRGPKALVDGPRGGFGTRGRGYLGRGDGRDRDFRDIRDEPPFARRGRGLDRGPRDRFETRDRRPSPTGRDRSRSPFPRDFRETREDPILRRRDSRDGPLAAGSSVSDPVPVRGRGGFRGRGRGDWEFNLRGRNLNPEERDPSGPRSRSRDHEWERQIRDDRDRERDLDPARRDENLKPEREDREHDDRVRRDQPPYRPDSRNSGGPPRTPLTSRSPSTSSMYQANLDRFGKNFRDARDSVLEPGRRPIAQNIGSDIPGSHKEPDRPVFMSQRAESERHDLRNSSPPPQAPPVPAFGSIPQSAPPVNHRPTGPQTLLNDSAPARHPSRLGLLESAKEAPSAPKAHILGGIPTAPKAQQATDRRFLNEGAEPSTRSLGNDRENYGTSNQSGMPSASVTLQDPAFEQSRNWSRRFSQPNADANASSARLSMSSADTSTQPSVKKAVEEQGRNGNVPSSLGLRPPLGDSMNQTSPIKIPTGPRAERGTPSIRQPIPPSIRGPPNRGPPPMMRGQSRPTSNWSWVRPGLPQHTPRGPSIMNTVPTKRDFVGEGKPRPGPPSAESTESAIDAWRRNHAPAGLMPSGSEILKKKDQDRTSLGAKIRESSDDVVDNNTSTGRVNLRGFSTDSSKEDDSDNIGAEDADLDFDEKDFAEAEKKFAREMQALEARRPPTPRSNQVILGLLEELDALACALEEKAKGGSSDVIPKIESINSGLPSPKIEDIDQMDILRERGTPRLPVRQRPQTPPVKSLPFLVSGPPTPFSEIGDLQDDLHWHEDIKAKIFEQLSNQQDQLDAEYHDARETFARLYKPWRMGVEDHEDERKAEYIMATSPPPDTSPLAAPTSAMAGRRRNMTALDYENIIKESEETAAREERARREREAPIYVSPDTFNPEREAVLPDMLNQYEKSNHIFADKNNMVRPEHALDALAFIPKPDDFSPAEQEIFLDWYFQYPKRFGIIAEKLDGRTYQDCVQHYYSSKLAVQYKSREAAFWKSKRGKRIALSTRAAQIRPNSNTLMGSGFDGPVDYEAQNVALNEKGRPRRAAAPVFGENGDSEPGGHSASTPARRTAANKEGVNNGVVPAKPGRKPRTVPAKEKVGRKGRAPLLAAAPAPSPGPSPQKESILSAGNLNQTHTLEDEQRIVELEGAQPPFAAVTNAQTYAVPFLRGGHTDNWLSGFPPSRSASLLQETSEPSKSEPLQTLMPQQRVGQGPTTSSYWSVPEKQDFRNYVLYFGTDWLAIADTMKTKTHTMIKNFYAKEINAGEEGRALEQGAILANQRRERGEDIGPLPPATPVPKRRYDTTASRDAQRPLAPLVDNIEAESRSPRLRPAKPQISPSKINPAPVRFSASAQTEEGAAALSSQMLSQGPSSPANRITIQAQQRPSQQLQGPRLGIFPDVRARQSTTAETLERQQHQQHQVRLQQQLAQAQQRQQEIDDQQMRQHNIPQQSEVEQAAQRSRNISNPNIRTSAQGQQSRNTSDLTELVGPSFNINIDENSRRLIEERYERERQQEAHQLQQQQRRNEAHKQQQQQQQQLQQQLLQRQPQIDPSSTVRRFGSGSYIVDSRYQNTPTKSPASASLPMPMSPPLEAVRPSSVPANASVQCDPPPKPKKSNILSILNDTQEDPVVSKRTSDPRPPGPTPPPQRDPTPTQQYQQAPQSLQLPPHRHETPIDSLQHLHHHHQRSSLSQQSQQQQQLLPPKLAREHTIDRTLALPRGFHEPPPTFQSHHARSPRQQSAFLSTSSRHPFQSLQLNHGPSPPPFTHSRASSYTSMQQQQQQQQQHHHQQQQQHQQQHQQSAALAAAHAHAAVQGRTHHHQTSPPEPSLRPSPYTALNPHQPTHQHHNPPQPHHLPPPPPLDRHLNHPPSRDYDYASHAEALRQQQHEALRVQEMNAHYEREREAQEREREMRLRMLGDANANTGGGAGGGGRYTPFYGEGKGGYEERR